MTRNGMAFDRFEARAWERDLSPSQCRAGRKFLELHLDDLADLAGINADELADFENSDERGGGLNICDRFKIALALWAAGVRFYRSAASEGVRIHHARTGNPLWNIGPSPPGLRAALALLGWNAAALADLSGIPLARVVAIVSGEPATEPESSMLIKTFRAASVRFYRLKGGEGVRVSCRRPWHRAWLEKRAPLPTKGMASK